MTPATEITVEEAATSLGLSPVTIRRAWREGRLVGTKGDGKTCPIMISPDSVEVYRARHLGKRGAIPRGDPRRA